MYKPATSLPLEAEAHARPAMVDLTRQFLIERLVHVAQAHPARLVPLAFAVSARRCPSAGLSPRQTCATCPTHLDLVEQANHARYPRISVQLQATERLCCGCQLHV